MTPGPSQILLTDGGCKQRCLAEVDDSNFGLEWACGRGALTEGLLEKWDCLVGYELDENYCRELNRKFSEADFYLVRTDILAYPLPVRPTPYPLVGNLPYHLTGPLLMKILRNSEQLACFQGLVQLEVAERMTARPGDSEFSSLSLLYQLHGEINSPHQLPATAFTPQPEVDSAWVNFTPDKSYDNFEQLRRLARRCYRYPRKTLLNNLAEDKEDKQEWRQFFESKNWNTKLRPHQLEPTKFLEVFDRWQQGN